VTGAAPRPPHTVELTLWQHAEADLKAVRRAVFVVEQAIPEAEEWDADDADCVHVLVRVNCEPVGTGRLHPTGKIGRLAVVSHCRRYGFGSVVLRRLIDEARAAGLPEAHLHAQVAALPFYLAHGFVPEGAVFDEVGIPHRKMRLDLAAPADHPSDTQRLHTEGPADGHAQRPDDAG
jgi:predicted GNAT family N-acyltransferase